MKSVNNYLLKSTPKEIADFIEIEKNANKKAFDFSDIGELHFYAISLQHCGMLRGKLTDKYGEFDQDGVLL
jgi:hypothetical protein